jgi:hypothetical protein
MLIAPFQILYLPNLLCKRTISFGIYLVSNWKRSPKSRIVRRVVGNLLMLCEMIRVRTLYNCSETLLMTRSEVQLHSIWDKYTYST